MLFHFRPAFQTSHDLEALHVEENKTWCRKWAFWKGRYVLLCSEKELVITAVIAFQKSICSWYAFCYNKDKLNSNSISSWQWQKCWLLFTLNCTLVFDLKLKVFKTCYYHIIYSLIGTKKRNCNGKIEKIWSKHHNSVNRKHDMTNVWKKKIVW